MQEVRLIKSVTVTPGSPLAIQVTPGRYAGLALRLTGTTDTGQTLALSEIGTLRLVRGGRQVQSGTVEFYHDISDLLGGYSRATLPTAGATAVWCPILFGAPGVTNGMEVISRDELVFNFDPLVGLATEFGANVITLELYGIYDDMLAEKYELHVVPQNFVASAAGQDRQSLNAKNIAFVALNDSSSVVDTFQLEVDDRVIVSRINDAAYSDWVNNRFRIESGGMTQMLAPTASGSNPAPYLNEKAVLDVVFSGAGTFYVSLFAIAQSPAGRRDISQAAVSRFAQQAAANSRTKLGG